MKFLVFNNKNGLGTADKLIVNWDSVKYIKPIDGDTFYIELNNGAYLEFDLSGANTSPKAIEAINRVVKANPNSRILEVKPRSLTEFVFSNIQYRVAASGSIDGSGVQYAVPVFTDTNTLTNLPLGVAGQFLQTQGNANPAWVDNPFPIANNSTVSSLRIGGSAAVAGLTTIIGFDVLPNDTTSQAAVAIGNSIGINTTSGNFLTSIAIGYETMRNYDAPGQNGNVAIGFRAMERATSGADNTIIGNNAGANVTNHNGNVIIGSQASSQSGFGGSGSLSVVIGARANEDASSFPNNSVIIGFLAGDVTTGDNNTHIGYNAGLSTTSGTNQTLIGNQASASSATASNEVVLGNSSISALRCQVQTITSLSDERDKTEIVDLDTGLDTVMALKPRKFVWNNRPEKVLNTKQETQNVEDDFGNTSPKVVTVTEEVEIVSSNKGSKDIGFIAQELQSVDNEWIKLVNSNNPDKLEASYGRLIPVLVKAIQELSAKVTTLENA